MKLLRISIFASSLLLPTLGRATGFEEPARWLDSGAKQTLLAPEFFFELEMKRLAAELHPEFHIVPPTHEGEEPAYEAQTTDADIADFRTAIEKGAIHPPDPDAAITFHVAARRLLDTVVTRTPEDADHAATPDKAEPAAPTSPAPTTDTSPLEPMDMKEFASEFADYHRGAWAWRHQHWPEAIAAWKALLDRPPAERKYRTTWAAYMLGSIARDEKRWDDARRFFQLVRRAAREGFVDTIGLAAASAGWEAQVEQDAGNPARGAQLFLEQLAAGDLSAVWSLKYLVEELVNGEPKLGELAKQPVLQRLITAYAVAGLGDFSTWEEAKDYQSPILWLKALEGIDAKNVKDADRVAWLSYQHGRFEQSARWLNRADAKAPYTKWLQAKFALREGKVDAAAKLLSQAVEEIAATRRLETRYLNGDEVLPKSVAMGDLGTVRLAQGEFIAALQVFVDAKNPWDAAYIAEGVLSVDELKKFVDNLAPEKPREDHGEDYDGQDVRPWLRGILASRLVRAGRYAEARPYLRENDQKTLDSLTPLLADAEKKGASKPEKIRALLDAARLIENEGDSLYQVTDVDTQASRLTGREAAKKDNPETSVKLGEKLKFVPPISPAEKERLRKHVNQPFRHSLHHYVAADLAWKAAALMPNGGEETAKVLNEAGNWLKYKDDDAADRFYQAIERRCPNTAIGREAIKKHWFVDDPGEQ